jgi:hypothetical protein
VWEAWITKPLPKPGQWVNLHEAALKDNMLTCNVLMQTTASKPYNLFQVAIPFGLGVRFKLNEAVDFSADPGFRYLFTDYIDDVSRNYVDSGMFESQLARALSHRSKELTNLAFRENLSQPEI